MQVDVRYFNPQIDCNFCHTEHKTEINLASSTITVVTQT